MNNVHGNVMCLDTDIRILWHGSTLSRALFSNLSYSFGRTMSKRIINAAVQQVIKQSTPPPVTVEKTPVVDYVQTFGAAKVAKHGILMEIHKRFPDAVVQYHSGYNWLATHNNQPNWGFFSIFFTVFPPFSHFFIIVGEKNDSRRSVV